MSSLEALDLDCRLRRLTQSLQGLSTFYTVVC